MTNQPLWQTGSAALAVAAAVVFAAPASADPTQQPPPFAPGSVVDCAGRAVPLDARVSIQNPLGTLEYWAFLDSMCGPIPPPQVR